MPENRVTIKIPRPLYERISEIIDGSGFSSATDFIVYVLRDLVGGATIDNGPNSYSSEELASIRQKLKNLGYLE